MANNQQKLFDTDPAPWEVDDAGEQLVATIVLPIGPSGAYDYMVPERLRDQAKAGRRVRVPLGRTNRSVVGYCVRVETRDVGSQQLKQIRGVVDATTLLSPTMLRLTKWMAEHYLVSWGQILEAVVPTAVRTQAGTRQVIFLSVLPEVAARLDQLKLSSKQEQVIKLLADSSHPLSQPHVANSVGCTDAPIRALRKKGLLQATTRRVQHAVPEEQRITSQADLKLNADQRPALKAILQALDRQKHETVLVHGITGSGKTEVYIQAIRHVVGFGRQAIVLVPEISLTPQTQRRFRARFNHVAVLHSHMSHVERHWQWGRIARGEVEVVVGARSAVFAPTPHLGLIVLDEEHDASFKQESPPRYHARDVALHRAAMEGIPLVLGSATPSLESWHQATEGKFQLITMPRRVLDLPLPDVHVVDLRIEQADRRSRGALSRRLSQAVESALKEEGQVILLLNRRGFSTHIQCYACGTVIHCPNCDIALTHHRHGEKAVCHYCDHVDDAPLNCPECGTPGIRYSGLGTQRLEAEVRARFPTARCLRMDSDAMKKHGSHEKALARFRDGDVQILVGTQMIAKGLDFPNVTLVGVVNADTALHFPDFRAAERTFQLVTQVAGRTGRGEKGGRVLVQTYSPDHIAIRTAAQHDFETFATHELAARRTYCYPPWSTMIRLVVRADSATLAQQSATYLGQNIGAQIESHHINARLLGPSPAPLAKLRGKYRFHLLLHGSNHQELGDVVSRIKIQWKPPSGVQWIVDIDPLDML